MVLTPDPMSDALPSENVEPAGAQVPLGDDMGCEETLEAVVQVVVEVAEDVNPNTPVSVKELIESVGENSFIPLLILPGLALISPLSGIPLFSTTMGFIIVLVAAQMLAQRDHLWLPNFLLNASTKSKYVKGGFAKMQSTASWLDDQTHRRLVPLTRRPLVYIPQILCVTSGALLPLLEIVPFSSSLIGLGVVLMAFGMLSRDGIVVVIGTLPFVGVVTLLFKLFV